MKKILFRGIKLSAWIGAILMLIVALLITLLMTVPKFVKAPIEKQLSSFSNLDISFSTFHLDFSQGSFFVRIDNLKVSTIKQKNLIAVADDLKWDIRLSSLLDDIYPPNKVSINMLTVYPNTMPIEQLIALLSTEKSNILKLLSINKTIIKGEKELEIAPILLTHDKLKISGQNFAFDLSDVSSTKVNIEAILPSILTKSASLIVPILISNDELSINAEIKFSNKEGDDWLEFRSGLDNMKATSLVKYLPSQIVDSNTYAWIKRAFVAGNLQDVKLHIKKNLSKSSAVDLQLNTELKELELLFHPDWRPLKKLNASFAIDGKKIMSMVHNTKLNGMPFKDIEVQIADLNKNNLDVEVVGKINTNGEQLVEFLKHAPLDKEMNKTLHQLSVSGKVDGDMKLIIPLDERTPILDIDLKFKDNHLSVLEGAIVVKDYNSKLGFHNNKIMATGVGTIRDSIFDIHINPSNRNDENVFGVELVNNHGFNAYITKQFDQSWRAKVESESLKGSMAIFLNENELPNVRLSDLHVTILEATKGDWKITPYDFPSMHLSTQGMYVNGNVLPNFKVDLTSKDNFLAIKNLQFKSIEIEDKMLNFNGFWKDGKTQLDVNVEGKNLTEFLKKFKIKEKVEGGAFSFNTHISCQCLPWGMNYQNMTGYFDIKVKEGVFTDKDPNLGRVLSLLNINSIAKRLKLDVADLTEKGFTYESIETQVRLKNAIATIEEFNLESLSSQIVLTGQGNLIKKEYDIVAKVVPAVSNAVPIATYLAGGGLIGLSIWLADKTLFDGKIIDSIVEGVAEFKYKVTGPWDKPIIKPL